MTPAHNEQVFNFLTKRSKPANTDDHVLQNGVLLSSGLIAALLGYVWEMGLSEVCDLLYLGTPSGPIMNAGDYEKVMEVPATFYACYIVANTLSVICLVYMFRKF